MICGEAKGDGGWMSARLVDRPAGPLDDWTIGLDDWLDEHLHCTALQIKGRRGRIGGSQGFPPFVPVHSPQQPFGTEKRLETYR